jgi:hypothetical protein
MWIGEQIVDSENRKEALMVLGMELSAVFMGINK